MMYKTMSIVLWMLFLFSCNLGPLVDVDDTEITEIHTTSGQELIDLKKALDSGAITQEEYEELKGKIIAREE